MRNLKAKYPESRKLSRFPASRCRFIREHVLLQWRIEGRFLLRERAGGMIKRFSKSRRVPEACLLYTSSQLKEGYVELFAGQPGRQARAKALADKVMDFSTFAKEKLGLSAESFNHSDEKVTYHASCHLCRGLGVKEAPRELIAAAADYVPAAEEEVCCGFGGTYSAKFPEVSAALLRKKDVYKRQRP